MNVWPEYSFWITEVCIISQDSWMRNVTIVSQSPQDFIPESYFYILSFSTQHFPNFFFFLSFFSPLRNLQVSKFSIHMEVKNQLQAYITKYVHDNNYNKNCSNDLHWENSLTEDRGKQSRRWYTCKGLHTTVSRFTKVACSVYHWDLRHPGLESTKYRQHDWIHPKGTT